MKAFKSFYFEAAHSLPGNPMVHGHSYRVTLWFATSIENPVNLSGINKVEWQVKRIIDHRMLNEFIDNPTMESISAYLTNYARAIIDAQRIQVELLGIDVDRPSINFGITT
jgi:6-pyruvoyl-tetrahydropterin synthase